MIATDLPLLTSVSRPTIHPDATRVVVAVSHPDLGSDSTVGQLWSVPLDGDPASRITRGIHDTGPQFSPDGTLLAFLRNSADGAAQLHVMAASGGEAVTVTDQKLGASAFRWAPDSSRIAFISAVAEHGRYRTVAGLTPDAEPPRQISTLRYRANGLGYTTDRRRQVFLVSVPSPGGEPVYSPAPSAEDPSPVPVPATPAARQLTFGDIDHGSLAFSADGKTLAVVAAGHDGRDSDLVSNIYLVAIDAETPLVRQVTDEDQAFGVSTVEFAPNGDLYFTATQLGESRTDFVGRGDQLWVLPDGGASARQLTRAGTVSHGNLAGLGDRVIDLGEVDSVLTVTDAGVLVQNRARGRVELLLVEASGEASVIVDGDVQVTGHDSARGVVAVTVTSPTSLGEVAVIENGGLRILTDFSHSLFERGITPLEELTIEGRDGYPIHGWVLTPEFLGPHPVILLIHGGPFAQWGVSYFDEAQVYVAAGYAVVMCNPRGAAGYGEQHARAIRGQMGTLDLNDVIDFLDGVIAGHPLFDADRTGIMGGSYGGYLTAWTIAHDHRFAAAIVERGYLDPDGFVGTSDIGSFFGDEYTGTDREAMLRQSPQAVVGQVNTPTLIIHSENDLRCPLGQGERYYAALKRNGVPAELLIFPGENHELTRSGRPRHRVQRFDAVLEWWSRYLPTPLNPARQCSNLSKMKNRNRLTSRILLFDEKDRLLLFLTRGSVGNQKTRWITPGGGVEEGETHEEGAIRELFEETGLQVAHLGDPVWTLDFEVDYTGADHDTGHAEYYLWRTRNFVPSNANWTPEEHRDVIEHRWWTFDELASTPEPYEPDELLELVELVGEQLSGL